MDSFPRRHRWPAANSSPNRIRFDGGNLTINFETSGAGGIQVEIQEADGQPLEGYTLDDCPSIFGDRLAKVVRWKAHGGDVRPLAGQSVRLRFVLNDADLYGFQFVPYAEDLGWGA